MNNPLVSICSITYNHAPFIRQCLDGFLMQQCNFPIEIIINDDCSTDGTTEIIREYAEKYPDKIFPIFHVENQWSKGERGIFQKFVFPKARGKYIALCEGDDYWTDPLKLQKQVDFLESHPECSLCCHAVKFVSFNGLDNPLRNKCLSEGIYKHGDISIATGSAVVRSHCAKSAPEHPGLRVGDDVLWLTCATQGSFYYMNDEMGVYRLHAGSWSVTAAPKSIMDEIAHYTLFYNSAMEAFSKDTHPYIKRMLAKRLIVWQRLIYKSQLIVAVSLFIKAMKLCPNEYIDIVRTSTRNKFVRISMFLLSFVWKITSRLLG
ncbi:MAG: glycosyltransferase [Akkermansia sp.]|nr:glycosyltransferase [Akkermansia sp.]